MNILFYDAVCPKDYVLSSLTTGGLGGTEACVLRISNKLKELSIDNKVTIAQRLRTDPFTEPNGLTYVPIETSAEPDIVVTLRDAGHYVANKKKWPNAKHYLWMHDLVHGAYRDHLIHHLEHHPKNHLICVSDFHKSNIIDGLRPIRGTLRVTHIYPPLADYATKNGAEYDKNKLIYTSSPHKGLDYVVKLFKYARNIDRNLQLYVSNPGYFPSSELKDEGIHVLGSLPHPEVLEQVRTSLCLFYPQVSFYETFGLVYAEANAVGTPALANPHGAAREVLSHPAELMDCRDYVKVIDRVLAWKSGERPIVKGKKDFQMSSVIAEWRKLL